MKQSRLNKGKKTEKLALWKPIIMLGGLFVGLLLATYYLYNHSPLSPRNYAAEVIKPIENKLISAGAVKKCNEADNGRTLSNRSPWYIAEYEVSGSPEAALQIVKRATNDSGYSLVESKGVANSPEGDLVYEDITKKSSFGDLQGGSQKLGVTIYRNSTFTDADKFSCTVSATVGNSNKTIVKISLTLPAFR